MLSVNISDIAIIAIKNVVYRCIIHNISKSKAINLLESAVVEDHGYIYNNIVLIFSLHEGVFFYFFCFSIYEMVGSKYSMDIYKSLNINIGTVMKSQKC